MNRIILTISIVVTISGCSNIPSNFPSRQSSIPSSTTKITVAQDIHPPIMHTTEWEKPIPLSNSINTSGAEDSPFITPDGQILYFFFTPDPTIPAQLQVTDKVTGIYVSQKKKEGWTIATRLALQKTNKFALDGCLFRQNNEIWFCSAREGYTGVNFFTSNYNNNKWSVGKYVGDKLMKKFRMGEMHITANGNELYFHSDRENGQGQLDIWVSKKENNVWQEPINLSVINSPENDGWPFVSQDGQELWFTRTYYGTPAIFLSQKIEGQWQKPELMISQFAGEPTLDKEGNLYFVHHYFKDNKMLEADIYMAKKK